MKVWRIAKSEHAGSVEEMLSGEGAARYGGRWNPKGVPAVYCSENSSLAALEILANLARPSTFPSYRILDLDVPDDSIAAAPSHIEWYSAGRRRDAPDTLGNHGTELRESARTQRRDQSGPSRLRQGASSG